MGKQIWERYPKKERVFFGTFPQESLRIFGEVVRGAKKGRIVLQTRKAFQRAEAKKNETLRGGGNIEDFIGE